MSRARFHLAFPVHDLAAARGFYGELLGCPEGRSSPHWVDFDLAGHQIVAHLAPDAVPGAAAGERCSEVDDHAVPVRHFGLILDWAAWEALAARLEAAGVPFVVRPYVRFAGQPGEQATFFVRDPSGNALEMKAFRSEQAIFDRGTPPASSRRPERAACGPGRPTPAGPDRPGRP